MLSMEGDHEAGKRHPRLPSIWAKALAARREPPRAAFSYNAIAVALLRGMPLP
jgi:hypothetical protein